MNEHEKLKECFHDDYMNYNRYYIGLPFSNRRKQRLLSRKKIINKYKNFVTNNMQSIYHIATLKTKGGILQEEYNCEYRYVFDIEVYQDSFGKKIYDVGYNGPGAYTSIRGYRNGKKFTDMSFLDDRLIFDIAYTLIFK